MMRHLTRHIARPAVVVLLGLVLGLVPACQTLREIASLRQLRFAISGATAPRLAGVDLSQLQSAGEISPTDMLRLGSALLQKRLDFDVTLLVAAVNPAENSVAARVVGLDWTLLLDDHETISGNTESDILIPPGTETDIPVAVSVNLAAFFDRGARDLIDLALAVSGIGGHPKRVKLRAMPTVNTALGPIRYRHPITIVSVTAGGGGG